MDITPYIKAKSDQLNADDLVGGPIDVKIMGVKQGSREQPVIIEIDGDNQPYKPCKTVLRVLTKCWGIDAGKWVGRYMRLYCDPSVMYAGVKVGGIRVSHLSDISSNLEIMVTATRGKRKPYEVKKLEVKAPEYMTQATFDEKFPKVVEAINAGKMTKQQAIKRLEQTAPLTDDQKAAINEIPIPASE